MHVKKTGMGIDPYPLQPMALRAKWTTFRQSKTNYQGVRAMQYLLKYDGFLNDKADGYFGANTLAAVKAAQRHYGLVVDGICGPNTWEKIYYVVSRSNYASRTNVSLAAKYMLRCRYGYTVVDYHSSYYGPQTEGAVKDFQDKCGIRNQVVYGRVGRTTWMYLIGSDKDLNLGKSSSGGSGGSDSSSSGGGSGGYTNGYAATATGMAEYAYSRIGDTVTSFYDGTIPELTSGNRGAPSWCTLFIHYCAKKVGFKTTTSALSNLTNSSRGSIIFQASSIPKGYTLFIDADGGHWGIAWSKDSVNIKAIEANTSYRGYNNSEAENRREVKIVTYTWDGISKYLRNDNYRSYVKKYLIN